MSRGVSAAPPRSTRSGSAGEACARARAHAKTAATHGPPGQAGATPVDDALAPGIITRPLLTDGQSGPAHREALEPAPHIYDGAVAPVAPSTSTAAYSRPERSHGGGMPSVT